MAGDKLLLTGKGGVTGVMACAPEAGLSPGGHIRLWLCSDASAFQRDKLYSKQCGH